MEKFWTIVGICAALWFLWRLGCELAESQRNHEEDVASTPRYWVLVYFKNGTTTSYNVHTPQEALEVVAPYSWSHIDKILLRDQVEKKTLRMTEKGTFVDDSV